MKESNRSAVWFGSVPSGQSIFANGLNQILVKDCENSIAPAVANGMSAGGSGGVCVQGLSATRLTQLLFGRSTSFRLISAFFVSR